MLHDKKPTSRKISKILNRLKKLKLLKPAVALALLVLFFYVFYFVILLTVKPIDVKVTNISAHSVTISWISKNKSPGMVIYSNNKKLLSLAYPFDRFISKMAFDDRDVTIAELNQKRTSKNSFRRTENISIRQLGKYYVHVVTLKGLKEKHTYYFKIGNGFSWWTSKFVKRAAARFAGSTAMQPANFSVTTLRELNSMQRPNPSFGAIVYTNGTPVKDALVISYLSLTRDDSASGISPLSMPLASALTKDGTYYIDLANARTPFTNKPVIAGDDKSIFQVVEVYTKAGLVGKQVVSLKNNAPAPDIIIDLPKQLLSDKLNVVALSSVQPNFNAMQESAAVGVSSVSQQHINDMLASNGQLGQQKKGGCPVGAGSIALGETAIDAATDTCFKCTQIGTQPPHLVSQPRTVCKGSSTSMASANSMNTEPPVPIGEKQEPRPEIVSAICSFQGSKTAIKVLFRDKARHECGYRVSKKVIKAGTDVELVNKWKSLTSSVGINKNLGFVDSDISLQYKYRYGIQVLISGDSGKCDTVSSVTYTRIITCTSNYPGTVTPTSILFSGTTQEVANTTISGQNANEITTAGSMGTSGPSIGMSSSSSGVAATFPPEPSGSGASATLPPIPNDSKYVKIKVETSDKCKMQFSNEVIVRANDVHKIKRSVNNAVKRVEELKAHLIKKYHYSVNALMRMEPCVVRATLTEYKEEQEQGKSDILISYSLFRCNTEDGEQETGGACKPALSALSGEVVSFPVGSKQSNAYIKFLAGNSKLIKSAKIPKTLFESLKNKILYAKLATSNEIGFDIESIYKIALTRRVRDGKGVVMVKWINNLRKDIKACPINKDVVSVINLNSMKEVLLCDPVLTRAYKKYRRSNDKAFQGTTTVVSAYYAYPAGKVCTQSKLGRSIEESKSNPDEKVYHECKLYKSNLGLWQKYYECARGYVASVQNDVLKCTKAMTPSLPANPVNDNVSSFLYNPLKWKVAAAGKNNANLYIYTPEGSLEFKSSGEYKFTYQNKTYIVKVPANDTYNVYLDENSNGKKDVDEPWLKDVTNGVAQIKLKPEKIQYSYTLNPGYNFVHFPFVFEDKSLGKASQLLKYLRKKGQISLIAYYDGKWHTVDQFQTAGTDGYIQDGDFDIMPGRGYVIRNLGNQAVDVNMWGYPIDGSASVFFFRGWNLVGFYNANKTYTASSLIDAINSSHEITSVNVTKWESGRYDGIQKEGKTYGFDFPIYWQDAYFINVKDIKDKNLKIYTWTP